MHDDRVLLLDGVHNFRDYGGYAVVAGGRLRPGILWRSGQHVGASDADLEKIAGLGLADVFDLRTAHERTVHPCRRPAGFAAAIHHPDEASRELAPHVKAAVAGVTQQRDAAATRESMRRNYGSIAYRPELIAMMRLMLARLADASGPSLVNCMAGKDRTGIAVAMVQLAAGVHRDDVIADYVLTNTAGNIEARIAAGAESIKATSSALTPEVLKVIMGVEPEYLESAFSAIADREGSLEAYLANVLGADDALRARLKHALVEF